MSPNPVYLKKPVDFEEGELSQEAILVRNTLIRRSRSTTGFAS